MVKHYLDFEKPLIELEREIEHLKRLSHRQTGSIQRVQLKASRREAPSVAEGYLLQPDPLANYPTCKAHRPTQDLALYSARCPKALLNFTGIELTGTIRPSSEASASSTGDRSFCLVIRKGHDAKEMVYRNFGMPHPEGYRKALRLMKMAEVFKKPILTLIDTPGAYPGVGAEERGQAEAIARNLRVMASLRTPIVSVVIGEGGSGGALAIGVGDRVLMLEYSIYSVISPEGCAAILWKDGGKGKVAAESLRLTAEDLLRLGVIDEVVKEPPGGAHRDPPKWPFP